MVDSLGDTLNRVSKGGEVSLLVRMIVSVSALSAFMNNTPSRRFFSRLCLLVCSFTGRENTDSHFFRVGGLLTLLIAILVIAIVPTIWPLSKPS